MARDSDVKISSSCAPCVAHVWCGEVRRASASRLRHQAETLCLQTLGEADQRHISITGFLSSTNTQGRCP
ncbi:hypothetical protein BsWGS_16985 [Bradybaena similaris]